MTTQLAAFGLHPFSVACVLLSFVVGVVAAWRARRPDAD